MRAKGLFHTGITVSDLDRTATFLKEWFGMEEVERKSFGSKEEAVWDNPVTGIKKTWTDVCFLRLGEVTVELLQYPSPPGQGACRTGPNDVGNAHLAFFVDDLDSYYERLTAEGYRFAGPIHYNVDAEGKRRAGIFFWDHDDISYELVYREGGGP